MVETLLKLFDTHHILFVIHGYSLSAIELFSTLLGIWSYVEIIRRKARGLIIGIISSLLLACLFHQLRLYSDMGLMLYYTVASLVALFFWRRSFKKEHSLKVTRLRPRVRRILLISLPLGIVLLAAIASHLHTWFPRLFPEPACFPLGDAFTTVFGIAASILLIQRKTEAMALWLAADVIATIIYSKSGVYFLASVYIAYMLIDLAGLLIWLHRSRQTHHGSRFQTLEKQEQATAKKAASSKN